MGTLLEGQANLAEADGSFLGDAQGAAKVQVAFGADHAGASEHQISDTSTVRRSALLRTAVGQ